MTERLFNPVNQYIQTGISHLVNSWFQWVELFLLVSAILVIVSCESILHSQAQNNKSTISMKLNLHPRLANWLHSIWNSHTCTHQMAGNTSLNQLVYFKFSIWYWPLHTLYLALTIQAIACRWREVTRNSKTGYCVCG